ncbi:MAG: endonuclease III [Nitrospira bacterium HGW-Nitrospira-1]|nr:MAG: endonuclease III [Nitrospira bacterium HGW-Nitrospira-1]
MADAKKIVNILLKKYPSPQTALNFKNPLELLVATILSAQCTDSRVNLVALRLFQKYKTAADFAQADLKEFEEEIKPTGFYRNKARAIINCCRMLCKEYDSVVPSTLDELVRLPGVGRKTANVILGSAFGRPAIAVDTHVLRVSNRLGLAHSKNPDKVEAELNQQIEQGKWTKVNHALILHGRETCGARRPKCGSCVIFEECKWPSKTEYA